MNINKVCAISFSPTKTSEKVVKIIAASMSNNTTFIDITQPSPKTTKTFEPNELVVIGVPVYAGRVAPLAAERLCSIKGSNTPAVIVVLYGNREYEDALIELMDIVKAQNFIPVAGAAFIGEHSFSTSTMAIGDGRPDEKDLSRASSFGKAVAEKVKSAQGISTAPKLKLPGNYPYKDGMGSLPFTPKVNHEECSLCGLCMETCPDGAITVEDKVIMDVMKCIFCCACIKNCPEGAITIEAGPILEKRQWLHENCSKRKEPELYY